MKIRKLVVEVSKTLQVERFEPVTVTLRAEAEVETGDEFKEVSKELYRQVSGQTKVFIQNEMTKHLMEVEGNRDARKKKGI